VALRRGEHGDLLRIPVLEAVEPLLGETSPLASDQVHIGSLIIAGSDEKVTMDLPRGTEIEVTLHHSASRETTVRAYIPLLDAEFEASFRSEPPTIDLGELTRRFENLRQALKEVEDIQQRSPLEEVGEALEALRNMDSLGQLEREIARAREGDSLARSRPFRELLKLSGAVEHLRHLQRTRRLRRQIDRLAALANGEDGERLRALGEDLARAEAAGDEKGLAHIEEVLDEMNKKLRGQPYVDLLLDLMALSGLRVAPHQHALFNRASQLMDEINARGGMEGLTENDRDRLLACHRELAAAHPELGALREKIIEDLRRQGKTVADLNRGDLERSKPH